VLGSHPSSAVISVDGRESQFTEVMRRILDEARPRIRTDYGIELVDVRIRQLTLPEQNRANVFARMQAERGKIAMKYRSEGEREFKKLVAAADREKTRILAEAYREAERVRAEGDAQAMQIYADAFARDPEFYKFTRTLAAYEKILDGSTTLFLPADAEVFRALDGRPVGSRP
jgi:membrane protease subunit HflC